MDLQERGREPQRPEESAQERDQDEEPHLALGDLLFQHPLYDERRDDDQADHMLEEDDRDRRQGVQIAADNAVKCPKQCRDDDENRPARPYPFP